MTSYEEFFTEDALLKYLCRRRMSLNVRLHYKEYFDKVKNGIPKNLLQNEILQLMPPRARWLRSPKSKRENVGPSEDSYRQNAKDLLYSVKYLRKKRDTEDLPWITEQNKFVATARFQALSLPQSPFRRPEVRAIPKDRTGNEYRLVASYCNLVDSAVISQCTNYLRQIFDDYFLPCSFAFRMPGAGQPPQTHHDAFGEICRYWSKFQSANVVHTFVAECDIQGFYDTLDHDIVLGCYDQAVSDLATDGKWVDQRARAVILSYLDSYSYNLFGRPTALFARNESSSSSKISDRDATLREFLDLSKVARYGVPQGGALSVFFANLVLHNVDRRVLEEKSNRDDMVYLRYCDDMIILGANQEEVNAALNRYVQAIRNLKLKPHELQKSSYIDRDSKEKYWRAKSKSTFLWGDPRVEPTAIPWVAFVGYELRYDGLLRVRRKSLQNELDKQKQIRRRFVQYALSSLKSGKSRKSIVQLLASLEGRLLAGGIGRRPEWSLETGMSISNFGWCAGFKGLQTDQLPVKQPIVVTQLRQLDRGMGRQLALARKALARYAAESVSGSGQHKRRLKFSGKPRSYAGQFGTRPE